MRRDKKNAALCFVGALLLSSPALASVTTELVDEDNTFKRLEMLHSKNLILQAEANIAAAQKNIREAQNETGHSLDADYGGGYSPSHGNQATSYVISITGHGNNLQALVALKNGQEVVLKKGSILPGTSLRVNALCAQGVTLSDGSLIPF